MVNLSVVVARACIDSDFFRGKAEEHTIQGINFADFFSQRSTIELAFPSVYSVTRVSCAQRADIFRNVFISARMPGICCKISR